MLRLLFYCLFLALATIPSGCQNDKNKKGKSAQEQLSEAALSLKEIWDNTDAPLEELKKLRQFEYQIVSFPLDTSPTEIQTSLNRLGKERWDCFHTEKIIGEDKRPTLLFFCKRNPETPLRYIPKL